jgi:hypothetical protein
MSEKYLKVIEALGEVIISKDLELSVLKYENERLKEKLDSVESYVNNFVKTCE